MDLVSAIRSRRWKAVVPLLIMLSAASRSPAGITALSTDLTRSNTFSAYLYGRVDVLADDLLGSVRFTVTPFDVQPLYGTLDNFGIQRFGFNYDKSAVTSAPGEWGLLLPGGWSGDSDGGILSEFGFFDVIENGTGYSRRDPLVFTLTLPTASQAIATNFRVLNSDGYVFAAHVAGFDNGPGSHWVAAYVPAPESSLLGVIGCGIVAALRRRLY